MTSWPDRAAHVQPAEDRLIDRYRHEAFGGANPEPGRGYPTSETPWGIGREFFSAMNVTSIGRRSAWPETQIVLDLFWENFPDRHFVVMEAIWPPDYWQEAQPPYNDVFWFNLAEQIHQDGRRWLSLQPERDVYLIWSNRVDLDNPPAVGSPPPELLAARKEIDDVMSRWIAPA